MKIGEGKTALDQYEWLPGHGENAIKTAFDKNNLSVYISYDLTSSEGEAILKFNSVCYHQVQSFPGPSLFNIGEVDAKLFLEGKLVEYPESEASAAWIDHFSGRRILRHFKILFFSENLYLNIIAQDFSLKSGQKA